MNGVIMANGYFKEFEGENFGYMVFCWSKITQLAISGNI